MNELNAHQVLEKEFPLSVSSLLLPSVKRAYISVEETIENTLYLKQLIRGREMRGYLKNVAVEYEMMKLVNASKIPFRYREVENARKNCHHIELYSERCVLTISQLATINDLPRQAIFRENHSLSNLMSLFDAEPITNKVSPYYAVLTHGYNDKMPTFVTIGIPEPYVCAWAAQSILLKKDKYINSEKPKNPITLPTEEKIPEKQKTKFKNYILERLSQHEKPVDQ